MDIGIAQEILNKKGLISRLELYSPEHDLDYTFINENKLTLVKFTLIYFNNFLVSFKTKKLTLISVIYFKATKKTY